MINENNTFFLLKPDAVKRNLETEIVSKVTKNGFKVYDRIETKLKKEDIINLYSPFTILNSPPQYRKQKEMFICDYLSSDKVVYLAVRVDFVPMNFLSVFEYARHIQGVDYYPERCKEGTIRFDLRDKNKDNKWVVLEFVPHFGDVAGEIVYNLMHTPSGKNEFLHQSKILMTLKS